jgi:hypothetical protein
MPEIEGPCNADAFKRCIKCKRHLPLCEFHRDRTKPDLHRNACKVCQLAAVKAYQQANGASIARTKRLYRVNNADKVAAAYQRRMANNPTYWKDYYAINRAGELARKRKASKDQTT